MSHLDLPRALAAAALGLAGCAGQRSPAPSDSLARRPAAGTREDTTGPFTLRGAPADTGKRFTLRYAVPDTAVRSTLRRASPCGSERAPGGERRPVYCEDSTNAGRPSLADVMRALPGFALGRSAARGITAR